MPSTGSHQGRDSLDAIGMRHGTDKATGGHAYLGFYDRFFRDLRDQPVRLLEIGVLLGQSVRMWSEYFPAGHIIGVDINADARKHAAARIVIDIADQSDVADLVRLGVRHGPFDIVIDDGSHLWNHQITTLQYLYPFVKPGGFFVVEDLHTSFGSFVPHYRGNATVSAVQYLKKLADYLVAGGELDVAAEEDPFLRSFAHGTEFIALHRRTAILRRGAGDAFAPLLPVETAGPELETAALTVHLGFQGDVTSRGTLVGGARGSRRAIQGFALTAPGREAEIQYKALLHDGAWTDWTPCGGFVGSRGNSVSLHGFAVRLGGDFGRRFACSYVAGFVGEADLVRASDGGACLGLAGGELEAMQINFRPRAAPPPAHAPTVPIY